MTHNTGPMTEVTSALGPDPRALILRAGDYGLAIFDFSTTWLVPVFRSARATFNACAISPRR